MFETLRTSWYHRIGSHIQKDVLVLLLFLAFINMPYFTPSFHFVPAHDTMYALKEFFFIYNEYALHTEIPLWMPYDVYGSPIDVHLFYTMSPVLYGMLFVGKLLSIGDALFLFKLAIVFEEGILLVGMYLLTKRLFVSRVTVLLVCTGALAISFWALQMFWNFRLYYLLPLIIVFLLKCAETHHWGYLAGAGILMLCSVWGMPPYCPPVFLLLYAILTVGFLLPNYRELIANRRTVWHGSTLLGLGVLLIGVLITLHYLTHILDHTMFYSPYRDHISHSVPIQPFLTYGGAIGVETLLELVYATPISREQTFYIGLIPLTFLLYVLLQPRYERRLKVMLVAASVLLLISLSSLTFLSPLLYVIFPFFDRFRHIGIIRAPAKILLLLASGFGLDYYLTKYRTSPGDRALQWCGLGVAAPLVLNLVVFLAKGDYTQATQDERAFQYFYHFFALCLLTIFLVMLYRRRQAHAKPIAFPILALFLIDIVSYHYWLFFNYPLTLPAIQMPKYATVEEYARTVAAFDSSFQTMTYTFQAQRATPEEIAQRIQQTSPLLLSHGGSIYATTYSAAYEDPCFQEYRIEYLPLGIDRFVRARSGIPLDKPLIGDPPLPNDLAHDPTFMHAMGCHAPKLFLTSQAQIARSLEEGAHLIKTSPNIDTAPVLWSETDQRLEPFKPYQIQGASLGTIAVTKFSANTLEIVADVIAPQDVWLIYLDAYHPQWRVTVNDQPQTIFTANLAFKAVRLHPGRNAVYFRFQGNGLTRIYVQIFLRAGIATGFLLIGAIGYILMSEIFRAQFQDMRQRWAAALRKRKEKSANL